MSAHQETTVRGIVASVSRNAAYSFSKPARERIMLLAGIGVDGDVHAGVTVRHRSRVRADPAQPNLRQVHLIPAELFGEVRGQGFDVAAGQLGENVTTLGLDLYGLPLGTILRFGPPRITATGDAADPAGDSAVRGNDAREAADAVDCAAAPGGADAVRGVVAAAGTATLSAATANAVVALVAAAGRAAPGGVAADPRAAVVITGLRNPCGQIDAFRDGLLRQVAHRDRDGGFVRRAGIMGVVLHGGPVRPGDPITAELPPAPHLPLDRV
jgi:MOSC domain-containing protein YiiM